MFLYFADRGCAPVTVPSRQANLFKNTGKVADIHMSDRTVSAMLFIATFVYCADKVGVNRVEVNVFREIQFVAAVAEGKKIVKKRLGGDFVEIITTQVMGQAVVESRSEITILPPPL